MVFVVQTVICVVNTTNKVRGWRRHMCRRKQIFEGAKDFCPISPNLPEKFLCDFCLQIFSHRDHDDLLLVWPPEKGLYSFFCKRLAPCFKVKQCSTPILSRFSGILKRYLGILLEFQGVCQNFQGFCPYLWQILRVRLHPLHPLRLHHWAAIAQW